MAVVPILGRESREGDQGTDGQDDGVELHLINGCSVEYDGPANVSTYFTPSIERQGSTAPSKEGLGQLTASFRGRLLRGATVTCESGYSLHVMQKELVQGQGEDESNDDGDGAGEAGTAYRIVSSTDCCSYWKHHVPVDPATDALYRAMAWVSTAQALHGADE